MSLFVSLLLTCIAMLYVKPNFQVAFHGVYYAQLSLHPFDFTLSNPLHYRFLGPLIGYVTFLKGDLYFFVPLVFAVLLLSAIYVHFRKRNFSFLESIIPAAVVAFSCTEFIPMRAAGYVDSITFYFLFLAFSFIKRPALSALFFGVALMCHECSFFLLPGLMVYANYSDNKNIFKLNNKHTLYLLACIPYIVSRYYISIHTEVEYKLSFYLSADNIKNNLLNILPLIIPGLFFAFKLFWIYPISVLVNELKYRRNKLVLVFILIAIPVMGQLIIAYDVTRLLCLLFPVLLISIYQVKENMKGYTFIKIGFLLILVNFLIPQYFASSYALHYMSPYFMK